MLSSQAMLLLLVAGSSLSMVIDDTEFLNITSPTYKPCPGLVTPTCGSDGNLYYSECDLSRFDGVTKGEWAECNTTHCTSRGCPKVYKPTCAADGNIYSNWCEFLVSNCGKPEPVNEEPLINCTKKICPESCDENDDACKKQHEICQTKYLPYITSP